MFNKIITGFISVCFLLLTGNIFAQSEKSEIKLAVRPAGDSIVLRWAPTSPTAWKLLNQYGYRIERITYVRDSKVLDKKITTPLSAAPVKPAPQPLWEKEIDTNDFVAIAAQAIFGETFEINNKKTDVLSMVHQSQELESRFSFALFAADISFKAASLSALGCVDRDVSRNEKYLYRVYSNVPDSIMKIVYGSSYIGLSDYSPLPILPKPALAIQDQTINVSIPVTSYVNTFTGFYVEKSDDGKNFFRLNRIPFVPTLKSKVKDDHIILSVIDSAVKFNQTYHYRMVGISAFGEQSMPSDHETVIMNKPLKSTPDGVKIIELENSLIKITWNFPTEDETTIDGFEVQHSTNAEDFTSISALIKPSVREFVDTLAEITNYYQIRALGKQHEVAKSFPVFYQKQDSIPPAIPLGLSIKMDTTGKVMLNWLPNKETDLLGYRVYRSNFKASEFSQITSSPVTDTKYIDSVNIRTLTKNIYYKITAVDFRYNTSTFSNVLKVIRPDVVPPVPPVLRSYKITRNNVLTEWSESPSVDIAKYILHVKRGATIFSDTLKTIQSPVALKFQSENLEAGNYTFQLEAIDSANNKSLSKIFMTEIKSVSRMPITDIKYEADSVNKKILFSWSYTQSNVKSVLVYKAVDDEALTLYKTLNANPNQFTDSISVSNRIRTYYFKVIFKDYSESEFTKPIRVNL